MTNDDRRERAHTDALRTAMAILQSQDPITDEIVGQAVAGATASIVAMRAVYGEINLDTERLRRQIEERVTVWTATQSALSDDRDHVPWLAAERAGIEWRFWERYRAFIADDLPPAAVRQVHNITDDILGRLESPRRDGAWDRRGMVVGQVQSGKTANYTGLICKAADAGYRLIIVLAGMHDSLRSQTQERLDEGFLGWDTQYGHTHKDGSRSHRTGVGAMVQNAKLLPVNTFTSSAPKGDFKRQIAQQVAPHIGSDPVVLVVKKHKTILENVIAWTTREKLRGPDGRELVMGQSLLVIDDEADNASVNTKEIERELDADGELTSETDPATINRLIRQLLNSFEQSAYIGYTATPFANIFIFEDEKHGRYGEDLFPRSFIVRIPPPSNYVGAPRVFGLPAAETPDGVAVRGLPVIRDVDDTDAFIENRTDKNEQIGPLPPSLREAVHAFVLTCAARAARGQGQKHCSMLVHVTRFVLVQSQVTDALREEMQRIQQRLRHGDGDRRDTVIDRLRELWDRDFEATFAKLEEADRGTPIDWDDIERHLLAAAMKIEVRAVNGSSADALTYKDHRSTGLSVIAVGGDKLSRGLTLEGLAISYYLRTSKMYDTLLQMGRWFGYRPGYLDLCRLYTTRELADWYRDITVANEELNREFDAMAQSDATPRDYGLRVRSHPDGLLVTARTKMRNAKEMRLSFAGVCPQTTVFDRRIGAQRHNAELTERFLRNQTALQRHSENRPRNVHLWTGIPGSEIARFLEEFQVSAGARRVNGPLLARYIHECLLVGELRSWTIALPSRRDREERSPPFADLALGRITRAQRTTRGEQGSFSVQAILNPPDETLDLTPAQLRSAAASTRRRFDAGSLVTKDGQPPGGPDGISARAARHARDGLLILYAIDPVASDEDRDLDPEIPLFGLAISFPKTRENRTIVYQVNNVFWQLELGGA